VWSILRWWMHPLTHTRLMLPPFPCSLVLETSSSPGLAPAPPLPLHRDRMLVSALPFSPSYPALIHLCLYLSLLLKMLFPSPVPQGSSWWNSKREGKEGESKDRWKARRGGRKTGEEGEELLTRRQKDNFGQAALFKVKA